MRLLSGLMTHHFCAGTVKSQTSLGRSMKLSMDDEVAPVAYRRDSFAGRKYAHGLRSL